MQIWLIVYPGKFKRHAKKCSSKKGSSGGGENLKGQNEQSAKISKQNQLAKKSKGQKNLQNENIKKFRKKVITDTSL